MLNPLYMESELLTILNDARPRHMILLDLLWPRIDSLRDRLPVETYITTGVGDALSFPLSLLYRLKELRNRHAPRIPYGPGVLPWKELARGSEPCVANIAAPDVTPALLQYTGGTTGLPKGVPLTHGNLGSNALQVLEVIRDLRHERHSIVGLLPFFHVYGLCLGITLPAMLAATSLPLPRYVPQDVLHLINRHRPPSFPARLRSMPRSCSRRIWRSSTSKASSSAFPGPRPFLASCGVSSTSSPARPCWKATV